MFVGGVRGTGVDVKDVPVIETVGRLLDPITSDRGITIVVGSGPETDQSGSSRCPVP